MEDQFSKISYLMLEVNSSCNLKCTFCNREELVAKGLRINKTITPKEFSNLLDYFSECPIDTVKLEGISEPMLHPQFDECAKVLKEKFPEAFVIIATNLQYDLKKTRFLQTLKYVDMVYLSIDGIGEIYEEMRKPASYKKLLTSLSKINELVSPDDKKKLHINFVLTDDNFHCLPEIYQLKEKFGLASVRINLAQNWSEDQLNKCEFKDEVLEFLRKYHQDVKGVPNWDYDNCFWPYEGLVIDVYGDIRQCVINTSQKPLGNIYRDNIKELFNKSAHYKKTRESLANKCATLNCENCDYKFLAPKLSKVFEGKNAPNSARSFKKQ